MVEVALARIAAGYDPNLVDVLKEMRHQRPSMVQTLDQYKFTYEAVMYAMQNQLSDTHL
jgi:protein tyrosine phosphatase